MGLKGMIDAAGMSGCYQACPQRQGWLLAVGGDDFRHWRALLGPGSGAWLDRLVWKGYVSGTGRQEEPGPSNKTQPSDSSMTLSKVSALGSCYTTTAFFLVTEPRADLGADQNQQATTVHWHCSQERIREWSQQQDKLVPGVSFSSKSCNPKQSGTLVSLHHSL